MHASSDAKRNRASRSPFKRANHFSFPPTQRNGLLDSPTPQQKRSTDQSLNLQASLKKLQASLDKTLPNQARAY